MVAKIKIGKSIRGILHYNENKVSEGSASLILACGFAGDVEKMNIQHKITRFQHLTELKPSVKTNALHISLNFEASENIENAKLQQIAIRYMDLIGFDEQPFLVYRHNDVAHQHIHIATTSIQRDGKSISLHNIGRELSEPARKQIEKEFNLIVAESKKFKPISAIKPVDPEVVNYGHVPTKRVISNVITGVMETYKFTSLAEFNAVLKQFNVYANRGGEDTEMFKTKGLQYSILDKKGNQIGVPIKASSFYSKPILRRLEKKFIQNHEKRKPYRQDLVLRIDKVLNKYTSISEATLVQELNRIGINLVLRKNAEGFRYGTTFVDHIHKTVFNGSDLGKSYSAKAINVVIGNDQLKTYLKPASQQRTYLKGNTNSHLEPNKPTNFLDTLLGKSQPDFAPTVGNRKKRKRKGITR
ncbi:relaxase/mobilization nuclease domain-containing protein [Pedobacter rhodius]|uniref:Relaxase/mobilization nuclease domain-containing protein n=1 Tax=Pedobacter rhodius TaxID=3004098 RepID=A0ABT4KZA1_9SPHI|nr:relaxase/mobilization nuclease domain-containing protein [Pedobacter sp. SJ11]MCZ4223532.1 relaxase/mobilization nuclease domain-containing protein [Pedobacter sp. SJ11]